jgi:HAD superfamily hydrolase (TIGR01459 family)
LNNTRVPPPLKLIENLNDLRGAFDVIFCDAWGVIHNGKSANFAAVNALIENKIAGVPVIILTNAPRTQTQLKAHFKTLGVDPTSYDAIISSGEVARDTISTEELKKCFHLGPKIDEALFEGINVQLVLNPNQAEFIFNSGLRDNTIEKAEEYTALLRDLSNLKLPMICVNPDRHVHIGRDRRDCAGALAEIYEQLGGDVNWIGKPFNLIYSKAELAITAILKFNVDPSRILAIGDALHTDILGAKNRGYQTLFVMNGIHKEEFDSLSIKSEMEIAVTQFCVGRETKPDYFITELC